MVRIPVEPPITEYLHAKAARNRIPLSGTFELTPVCNMSCRMCYVRMTKQQQEAIRPLHSAAEWLALGQQAKDQGMLYLLLTGGEPFLRPDFREIMTGLQKMGLVISINSNGTLIDEETVAWLKQSPPTRINITLYGASDETYARLCGNPKGYTQVVKAIRLLRDAGITVKLNCSLTPYNIGDLEKMMAFAKQEQLIIQATTYMFPPLRRDPGQIGKNDRFTPEQAAYYAAKVESLLNGEADFLKRLETMDLSLPSDPEETCLPIEGDGIHCRAGKCSFWVTWDGRFLPCGMLPGEDAPNVFEAGFAPSWEYAKALSCAIRLPAKCSACGIKDRCKVCAAMAITETGAFDQVPEYRCRMSHAYYSACEQLRTEILQTGADK